MSVSEKLNISIDVSWKLMVSQNKKYTYLQLLFVCVKYKLKTHHFENWIYIVIFFEMAIRIPLPWTIARGQCNSDTHTTTINKTQLV